MALTPHLESIEDLFRKLEREWQRAHNAEKEIDQADHFYNFCVTAHAMRDYFFEHMKIEKENQQGYHEKWNKDPYLLAAKEIANTLKHFRLKEGPKTKAVEPTARESPVFLVETPGEKFDFREESVTKPDLVITLENGEEWSLWDFKSEVIAYWQKLLIDTRLITVPVVHGSERDVGRDRV